MFHGAHAEVKMQLPGVSSLYSPLCGFWSYNSACQSYVAMGTYTHLPISPTLLFVLKGIFKITFKDIYNI